MAKPKPLEPTVLLSVKTPASLRAAFVAECKKRGTTASQVLREVIASYVQKGK